LDIGEPRASFWEAFFVRQKVAETEDEIIMRPWCIRRGLHLAVLLIENEGQAPNKKTKPLAQPGEALVNRDIVREKERAQDKSSYSYEGIVWLTDVAQNIGIPISAARLAADVFVHDRLSQGI